MPQIICGSLRQLVKNGYKWAYVFRFEIVRFGWFLAIFLPSNDRNGKKVIWRTAIAVKKKKFIYQGFLLKIIKCSNHNFASLSTKRTLYHYLSLCNKFFYKTNASKAFGNGRAHFDPPTTARENVLSFSVYSPHNWLSCIRMYVDNDCWIVPWRWPFLAIRWPPSSGLRSSVRRIY